MGAFSFFIRGVKVMDIQNQLVIDEGLFKIDIASSSNQQQKTRAQKTKDRHLFRRFNSERVLEDTLDWELQPDCAYHILSGGDVDSLSFLKFILRQQPLSYCLLSTWCMANADIEELDRFLNLGRIKRLDCYVGEIFKGSYHAEWVKLCELLEKYGGRVGMFRNHSKIMVGFGERFDFVIESSANVNTNPRTENTVITLNRDLAEFYKSFFDGIVSFERNFDSWSPYALCF
jgi:hypothetical protein